MKTLQMIQRNERIEKMLELRDQGYSLRAIGEMNGISRERVRQLIGNTGFAVTRTLREDAEWLRKAVYIERSITKRGVAIKYKVSFTTVCKVLGPGHKYLFSLGKRKCYRCHKIKDVKEFGNDADRFMGIACICKDCNRAAAREYYQQVIKPKRLARQDS